MRKETIFNATLLFGLLAFPLWALTLLLACHIITAIVASRWLQEKKQDHWFTFTCLKGK